MLECPSSSCLSSRSHRLSALRTGLDEVDRSFRSPLQAMWLHPEWRYLGGSQEDNRPPRDLRPPRLRGERPPPDASLPRRHLPLPRLRLGGASGQGVLATRVGEAGSRTALEQWISPFSHPRA